MDPFGLPSTKISQFRSESKTGLDMTPFPGALNTPEKCFQTAWDNVEPLKLRLEWSDEKRNLR